MTSVSLNVSTRTLGGSTTILYAIWNSGLSDQKKEEEKEELEKMERTKEALEGVNEPGFVELLFP